MDYRENLNYKIMYINSTKKQKFEREKDSLEKVKLFERSSNFKLDTYLNMLYLNIYLYKP